MKLLLALSAGAVLLTGGVLLYRHLLMPWHKQNEPTMAEQRRAAFGQQPKRYRVTQPAKPSWRWQQRQLKRHRSA